MMLGVVTAGCPSRSPGAGPVPVPVDAALAPCVAACTTMAALGCASGNASTCPVTMTKIDADKEIRGGNGLAITCSGCASAKTAADVAALCGSSCSP